MNQQEMKPAVADAALAHIKPRLEDDTVLGIGTGSTANLFIDALAPLASSINATVASSEASAQRLKSHGIPVFDLNTVDRVDFYIDGADETNEALQLIKGGGAALTREKIVAAVAKEFVCIADESKQKTGRGKGRPTSGRRPAAKPSTPKRAKKGKAEPAPAEAAAWAQLGATLLNLEAAIRRG